MKNTITKDDITYNIVGKTNVKGVVRTSVGLLITRGDGLNSNELRELLQEIGRDNLSVEWQIADMCALAYELDASAEKEQLMNELLKALPARSSIKSSQSCMCCYRAASVMIPRHLRSTISPQSAYRYVYTYRGKPYLQEVLAKHTNLKDALEELRSIRRDDGETVGAPSAKWAAKAFDSVTVLGRANIVRSAGAEAEVLYAESIADYTTQLDATKLSNDELVTLVPIIRDLCTSLKPITK